VSTVVIEVLLWCLWISDMARI